MGKIMGVHNILHNIPMLFHIHPQHVNFIRQLIRSTRFMIEPYW